jgi:phospholipase C
MRNGLRRSIGLIATFLTASAALTAGAATASGPPGVARYDHIFVIVEENHGFADVVGNPAAPNLNALASQFGIATQYFGVTHPSEPNYVALLGGSPFGVTSDNPYWTQSVAAPSLISQLDAAHISWKAYLQGLPHPGFQGICYPVKCNGAPDIDPLYVSKHDAIQNFISSRNPMDWSRQVPSEQLGRDLSSGRAPPLAT